MKQVSFEGMGGVVATFAAQEGMTSEAQAVKMTASGEVGPCEEGDDFCGAALMGAEEYVAVQMKGFALMKAGGEIGVGWVKLSADGSGGVKADAAGKEYLVVEKDTVEGTIVVLL